MRPSLCLLLFVAACSRSTATPPTVLATATIDAAGGEIAVTSGSQAGLRLTVPPGALTGAVAFRIVDVPVVLPSDTPAAILPSPADPFRIEPAGLYLDLPATLRMPYVVQHLGGLAPGNVRVRQSRNGEELQRDPSAVDVDNGFVELATRTLGECQVVRGPRVDSLAAYQPTVAAPVALTDGWSFAVEAVPEDSPFAATGDARWHLTGPGFDEQWYFHGGELLGRESAGAWRETWVDPFQVLQNLALTQSYGATTLTQVAAPPGLPGVGGLITAAGTWHFDAPRQVGDALAYDVIRVQVTLAWQRADLGTGQRTHDFWFAPEHGLLALAIDGVEHERAAP